MGLFGFGKKQEVEKKVEKEVKEECSCGGGCCGNGAEEMANAIEKILILGGGCDKCNQLEANTVSALAELGMDDAVGHITDFGVIATYGVMSTPALVVDGKVVSMGKVSSTADIVEMIKKVRA